MWVKADVHYTAAHHYSPERANSREFTPFWEFVSWPPHAGAFGPSALDPTFGPQVVFQNAPPAADTSPLDGYQHFGEIETDRESKELTVFLRDANGDSLWTRTPTPGGPDSGKADADLRIALTLSDSLFSGPSSAVRRALSVVVPGRSPVPTPAWQAWSRGVSRSMSSWPAMRAIAPSHVTAPLGVSTPRSETVSGHGRRSRTHQGTGAS